MAEKIWKVTFVCGGADEIHYVRATSMDEAREKAMYGEGFYEDMGYGDCYDCPCEPMTASEFKDETGYTPQAAKTVGRYILVANSYPAPFDLDVFNLGKCSSHEASERANRVIGRKAYENHMEFPKYKFLSDKKLNTYLSCDKNGEKRSMSFRIINIDLLEVKI